MIASLRRWVNQIEIREQRAATLICKLIPASCPFARNISVLGFWQIRIPPLCKLNPLSEQLFELRFRAACFLLKTEEN